MAPREATNSFADQALCLDYEGGGGVAAMLPHDPTPPIALDGDDDDDHDQHMAATTTVGGGDHQQNVRGGITGPLGSTGGGTAEPLNSTVSTGLNAAGGPHAPSPPVDPLSIDPTSDEHSQVDLSAIDRSRLASMDVHATDQQHLPHHRRRPLEAPFVLPVPDNTQQHPTVSPLNSGYSNSGVFSIESGGAHVSPGPAGRGNHHHQGTPTGTNDHHVGGGGVFFPQSPARSVSTTSTNINTNLISRRVPNQNTLAPRGNNHIPPPVALSSSHDDLEIADAASLDDGHDGGGGSAFSEVGGDEQDVHHMLGGHAQSPLGSPTRFPTSASDVVGPRTPDGAHGDQQPHSILSVPSAGSSVSAASSSEGLLSPHHSGSVQPVLSFGPNTSLADLKYFAERGCIVALLSALGTPKLTALGARMLADYAKNPTRRVAVAGNRRILEFTLRTMCGKIGGNPNGASIVENTPTPASDPIAEQRSDVLSRERAVEYAVETIRSLTATEESDRFLMSTPSLLPVLATLAAGGFVSGGDVPDAGHSPAGPSATAAASSPPISPLSSPRSSTGRAGGSRRSAVLRSISRSVSRGSSGSLASNSSLTDRAGSPGAGSPVAAAAAAAAAPPTPVQPQVMINSKSRLHACIAIMNLSCGKGNKIEIAKIPRVLTAMRDVMTDGRLGFGGSHSSRAGGNANHAAEARLKATTCIKNLSNADANDSALLGTPGLIEALGHVILVCVRAQNAGNSGEGEDDSGKRGAAARATTTVTNACLALMNLSIAKANKHKVFQTPGVMEALMVVITKGNGEARVKSCSALSNLAIGYDNKIPMFCYPGFVEAILHVIEVDRGEARTKACSILWSFAAEMRNQIPVVQRGDILPVLVRVAEEDATTEARFKCVAALTLLAESIENAMPLLESGALAPLMDILHDAGPDPTQWKGQTASWCVGFLMNMAQSDEAVPALRNAGVVELLAPLLTLDHYQSLKAAMAVTFVCRYDEGDETYDLLRKTETVIPKIINLLHNTLSGKGGNGYKYGVFTLRSSVGCIASLASGPDFMKERIATGPVYESLLRVLADFCVDCSPGAIVGGGRDDPVSPTLAVQALHDLTGHLIPTPGTPFPFGPVMEERLVTALSSFEVTTHPEIKASKKQLAREVRMLLMGYGLKSNSDDDLIMHHMPSGPFCCVADINRLISPSPVHEEKAAMEVVQGEEEHGGNEGNVGGTNFEPVRTFLLSDGKGRRFAVPTDPSGGRSFNDNRVWCYRRGRFCLEGEVPDPNFRWTPELQNAYAAALARQREASSKTEKDRKGSIPFC